MTYRILILPLILVFALVLAGVSQARVLEIGPNGPYAQLSLFPRIIGDAFVNEINRPAGWCP